MVNLKRLRMKMCKQNMNVFVYWDHTHPLCESGCVCVCHLFEQVVDVLVVNLTEGNPDGETDV